MCAANLRLAHNFAEVLPRFLGRRPYVVPRIYIPPQAGGCRTASLIDLEITRRGSLCALDASALAEPQTWLRIAVTFVKGKSSHTSSRMRLSHNQAVTKTGPLNGHLKVHSENHKTSDFGPALLQLQNQQTPVSIISRVRRARQKVTCSARDSDATT